MEGYEWRTGRVSEILVMKMVHIGLLTEGQCEFAEQSSTLLTVI